LKVTVTVVFSSMVRVHGFVLGELLQFCQLPKVEPVPGFAVKVNAVPVGISYTHALEQLIFNGEISTVPEPLPAKVTVSAGPLPLPLPVKHTTLAVMEPVTTAPDEDTPELSLFVVTLAETMAPPHRSPVAVRRPVELIVTNCGVFDSQDA